MSKAAAPVVSRGRAMHARDTFDQKHWFGWARVPPYLTASLAVQEAAMSFISVAAARLGWRTPAVIILCGCLISLLGFGPRSSFGLFLNPMSSQNGWGRDVFALAFAIQNLLWGIGQPFAGAIADRFGSVRV